jgi:hypothetical protein
VRDDGWVYVREPPGARIIEGVLSCEIRDLQGDIIELDAVVARMPWIALNAPLCYKHGHDRSRGVCPLGEIVAWKYDAGAKQILVRDYIKEGSPLVDDIYHNEIQPIGTRAGFSIGGAVLDKTCWVEKGKPVCNCHDTDVVEHSWTPRPANPRSYLTYVSVAASLAKQRQLLAMAKGMPGRLGTVLQGYIHQAYTVYCDELVKKGLLSTEERIKIGNAVGTMLEALDGALPKDLAEIAVTDNVAPEPPGEPAPGVEGDSFFEDRRKRKKDVSDMDPKDKCGGKLGDCIEDLKRKGHTPESAARICQDSVGKADEQPPKKKDEEEKDGPDADQGDANSGAAAGQAAGNLASMAMLLISQDELDQKEADLNTRLKGTYAHYPIPVKAGEAVGHCGVCDDLATFMVVGKGASVASALKELQVRLDSAQGEALRIAKELEDKKTMKKEGEGAAPPAQGGAPPAPAPTEEAKGLQAVLAKLAELEQRIAACEGKGREAGMAPGPGVGAPAGAPVGKTAPIGTGEKPKPGGSEGTETPDDIDRKTMSTTKEQQLATAIKMVTDAGYHVAGVEKGRPDAMPTAEQGHPGGILPMEKDNENDGLPPAFKRAMDKTRSLAHPQGGSA